MRLPSPPQPRTLQPPLAMPLPQSLTTPQSPLATQKPRGPAHASFLTRAPSLLSCAVLLSALLSALLSPAAAMIVKDESVSVPSDFRFSSLFSFTFAQGGSLDLTLKAKMPLPVTFMLCSDAALSPLQASDISFSELCSNPRLYLPACTHYGSNDTDPSSVTYTSAHALIGSAGAGVPMSTQSTQSNTHTAHGHARAAGAAPYSGSGSGSERVSGSVAAQSRAHHYDDESGGWGGGGLPSASITATLLSYLPFTSSHAPVATANAVRSDVTRRHGARARPASTDADAAAGSDAGASSGDGTGTGTGDYYYEDTPVYSDLALERTLVVDVPSIPARDRYRLLQLNCRETAWSGSLSYTAMNPGGEHLSLTLVPYKTLYLWLVVAYVYSYTFMLKLQCLIISSYSNAFILTSC